MSTALVSMCRDEADIAEYFLRYSASQVDELIVADNLSSDGTRAILDELAGELPLRVLDDPDPAYRQAEKMTALCHRALEAGHQWAVCADFDEMWYAPDGRRVADFLAGHAPDVAFVTAALYNHLSTGLDAPARCDLCGDTGSVTVEYVPLPPDRPHLEPPVNCSACGGRVEPNPFRRIKWRQREHGQLGKIACRLRPGLEVRMGNHSAYVPGGGVTVPGLVIRHFSWRSAEQYLHKVRVGEAAYAAAVGLEGYGEHWRMWAGLPDEAVLDHYRRWYEVADPATRDDLIYDPAPLP